ncbi:hypothetical protein HGM15179_019388 [Zosterops borbonicus]|uniref:Uncharacterized protein n=1 Tax=Zosterops borbonicus TaxID=364589 RepID=A0A8K1FXL9_9PASS|nr:hypothetical protein HGM15179_019388 [Zosterops borbonicus]
MGPLKNTLAAEKMVYLAIGGNPMGEGKGRGLVLETLQKSSTLKRNPSNKLTIKIHAIFSSPVTDHESEEIGTCPSAFPREDVEDHNEV